MSVQAVLGPFSNVEEAKRVQQEWRKPHKSNLLRLKDPEKGLEKEGRDLARKYSSTLIEYWDFLETYCDLTSDHGLRLLDNYLHERMECSVCSAERLDKERQETSLEYFGTEDENSVLTQHLNEQGD